MANILITSALPYINGVKHLGNLAGSLLPADIQARHRRQIGDAVLFICATDEHGTPAELAAAEAGLDVAAYCARQHEVQADIYRRFHLSFDHFGRTSSARNHALTQHLFERLEAEGFVEERVIEQVYSQADERFLPDRYIIGTCPHCGFAGARGDQCESCTRPLDPVDLIEPRSALSGSTDLTIRESRHLFLRQSALVEELDRWIASRSGWPPLVTSIARKWLTEGLKDRCITRDLAWGVKVPRPGFDHKVFYVWFDAPIGYIAATQEWADADPANRDWRSWWWEAQDVTYLQFLGKDNVPFHAVSFPCTLIGSREAWTRVDIIKGVNWLTYEGGKFSTSGRRGVFLDQALELLPADRWRWWLAANAPEGNDADFSFRAFAVQVNHDLADSFGNLVNRVLRFVETRHAGLVPQGGVAGEAEERLGAELDRYLVALLKHHGACALRKATQEVAAVWRLANAYLAAQAPWTLIDRDPERAALVIRTSVNLVDIAARLAWPFIPATATQVLTALGEANSVPPFPLSATQALSHIPGGRRLASLPVLFDKLQPDWVEACERQFAGEAQPAGSPWRPAS
ncbi:methionyl-tRNA synthetase [Rhizobiales bacterium GAS191]|nr:methionyl-tRNA synthetase [Rhizobiales bacterium GAS191]